MLLSSNVALFGGNSTKPGPGYCALIKAALPLMNPPFFALSHCALIKAVLSLGTRSHCAGCMYAELPKKHCFVQKDIVDRHLFGIYIDIGGGCLVGAFLIYLPGRQMQLAHGQLRRPAYDPAPRDPELH